MDGAEWTERVGQRVVIRYHRQAGLLTDVVGDLIGVDSSLHIITKRGPISVPLDLVVVGRTVPPRPSRRGPAHLVTSITDLEAMTSLHWRAAETERLGGWLLRASEGFTGRANSVLPLGDPRTDPDRALQAVRTWYGRRGLPAKVSVAGPIDSGVPDDGGPATEARAACLRAGWQPVPDGSAVVLTAPTAQLMRPPALPDGLTVRLAAEPDRAWLENFRYRSQLPPPAALALLRSAPQQTFASIRDGDSTVAVARGSLGGGWAGLTAVEVQAGHRRRGMGRALVGAIADWAWDCGAGSTYLQVAETNERARAFYSGLGFALHHRYDYLQAP
jgi:GNAT superfamily N-acetyltransferase